VKKCRGDFAAENFFGHIQENSGKNPSHPQKLVKKCRGDFAAENFFGHIQENSGKNPSHPQKCACS